MGLSEKPTSSDTLTETQVRSLDTISRFIILATWGMPVLYLFGLIQTGDQRYLWLIADGITLSVLALIARLVFYRRGNYASTSWMIIASVIITVCVFNIFISGLGLIIAILTFLVLINVAWQTIPPRQALQATIFSAVGCLAMYVIDASLSPDNRIQTTLFLQQAMVVVGGIAVLIFTTNLAQTVQFKSIRNLIRLTFAIISLLPLLIASSALALNLTEILNQQTNNALLQNATRLSDELSSSFTDVQGMIKQDAILLNIINFLKNPSQQSNVVVPLALRNPYIISYALLDERGINLIDSAESKKGLDESNTEYYQSAALRHETFISNVELDPILNKHAFYFSTPVVNELGDVIGIIRVEIDAEFLQQTLQQNVELFGEGYSAILLDENNLILAHSAAPDLRFTSASFASLIRESSTNPFFKATIIPGNPNEDSAVATQMFNRPWKVVVAQNTDISLQPLYNQLRIIFVVSALVILAVIFAANLNANTIATPINKLALAAEKIGQGKLDTSIRVDRDDEIGILSNTLETNATQLFETLQMLESRVQERTAELELANQKNLRRAVQLEAVAKIAHTISSLKNLEELLPEITKQISEAFGYYHAGIFLVDANHEYAILRASNSEGGQRMLNRGHRLKVGREGIVGFVTNTGHSRIALDVGDDAVFFSNPDLPGTRSEMALPLIVGEDTIGALDVQSTVPGAFTEEDIRTLGLLGDQISVAIQNARLFDETKSALTQLEEVYKETIGVGWQTMLYESGSTGFRFVKGNVEPIQQSEISVTQVDGQRLEVPIMLRGEKLGALSIHEPGRDHPWSDAEIRMYQSIVERMSFAIENAQLFSDARRRVNFERMTSDISTKISASVRFEMILKTAAEEISRILGGSEVLVQIQPEITPDDSLNKPTVQD